MRTLWCVLALVAAALLAWAPAAALAKEDEKEEKVALDQCPAKVQETLKKEADGGTIKEIEKETEGGKVVFEAEIVKGGKTIEVTVDSEGKVLEREEEIALNQCPKKVQATLKKEAKGGKIKEIKKETEGDTVTYEAEIVKGGKTIEVSVDSEGKVLERETEDEDDDDEKHEKK